MCWALNHSKHNSLFETDLLASTHKIQKKRETYWKIQKKMARLVSNPFEC
jgi:hypothetical protein